MAKISALPLLAQPSGAEAAVVLDGAVTKRVPIAAVVDAALAPHIADIAAREHAAEQAAINAGAYLGGVQIAVKGLPTNAQLPLQAVSRAMLATFSGQAAGRQAMLSEGGRAGLFVWLAIDCSALVTADPLQGMTVAPAIDPSGASGAWARVVLGPLLPDLWGADPTGRTESTAAFYALAAWVNAKGSGDIKLSPGATYLIRPQTAGKNGFFFWAEAALDFTNCTSVVVDLNGATMKFVDGYKFGSFDPATGNPLQPAMPYYNGAARADAGIGIRASSCGLVVIRNGTINCNAPNAVVGGQWGDTGRQCAQFGYFIQNCLNVVIENLDLYDSCQDLGAVAQYGLPATADARPHTLRNVRHLRSARNPFSTLGANAFVAENCTFAYGGAVANAGIGTFGSAPGSGVDVEAEGGVCRNVTFRDCTFGPATGNCFVSDSGDTAGITFEDCRFNGIFWTSKPFTRLTRCTLNGVVRHAYGGLRGAEGGTIFVDCILNGNRVGDLLADSQGSGALDFQRCQFNILSGGFNLRGSWLRDCSMVVSVGTDEIPNNGLVGYMEGATTSNFTVSSAIPDAKAPATGYYIAVALNDSFLIGNAKASGKIFWGVGGPSFQGELWTASYAYAGKSNTTSTVISDAFAVPFPLARRGDRIEVRFDGYYNCVSWTAGVPSDDQIYVSLVFVSTGGSLGPGTFRFRLYKGGL